MREKERKKEWERMNRTSLLWNIFIQQWKVRKEKRESVSIKTETELEMKGCWYTCFTYMTKRKKQKFCIVLYFAFNVVERVAWRGGGSMKRYHLYKPLLHLSISINNYVWSCMVKHYVFACPFITFYQGFFRLMLRSWIYKRNFNS